MEYKPLDTTTVPLKFKKNEGHDHSYKNIKDVTGYRSLICFICGHKKKINKRIFIQKEKEKNYKIGKVKVKMDKYFNYFIDFKTKEEKEKPKQIIVRDYNKLWKDSIKHVIRKIKYDKLITVYKEWNYKPPIKIKLINYTYKINEKKIDYSKMKKYSWLIDSPDKITHDYVIIRPLNKRK